MKIKEVTISIDKDIADTLIIAMEQLNDAVNFNGEYDTLEEKELEKLKKNVDTIIDKFYKIQKLFEDEE